MAVSQFSVSSGGIIWEGVQFNAGTLDFNGSANCLILDADGDTHLSSPTDDQIDISIGGADDFVITADTFTLTTGSTIAGASSTFGTLIPIATQQNLSGAGAINVTTYYTAFTSTGAAQALTLGDGVRGQLKLITHVVDGGSGVLTPSNLSGGTTITFTTVSESALLYFNGTDWLALMLFNPATPGTPPVLA